MEELNFTWKTGIKLFVGLMIVGAWLMARQQSKLDDGEKSVRAEALAAKEPVPERRIVPGSNYLIVVAAIVVLIIALMWGNESTI